MLCLIAKGVHLEKRVKRTDAPETGRINAYDTFATELNLALHGDDYRSDISIREIIKKLDDLLDNHSYAVGKGGLVERNTLGHVTRTMSLALNRELGLNRENANPRVNSGELNAAHMAPHPTQMEVMKFRENEWNGHRVVPYPTQMEVRQYRESEWSGPRMALPPTVMGRKVVQHSKGEVKGPYMTPYPAHMEEIQHLNAERNGRRIDPHPTQMEKSKFGRGEGKGPHMTPYPAHMYELQYAEVEWNERRRMAPHSTQMQYDEVEWNEAPTSPTIVGRKMVPAGKGKGKATYMTPEPRQMVPYPRQVEEMQYEEDMYAEEDMDTGEDSNDDTPISKW